MWRKYIYNISPDGDSTEFTKGSNPYLLPERAMMGDLDIMNNRHPEGWDILVHQDEFIVAMQVRAYDGKFTLIIYQKER